MVTARPSGRCTQASNSSGCNIHGPVVGQPRPSNSGGCYKAASKGAKKAATDRIMGALDRKNIIRWQVSARRAGERLPMYVVLNAPYRVTNTDIHTAMARYGDVNIVKQQKYRQ